MRQRLPSCYLDARQLRALDKVGNCFVPGDDELPSFSRSGCVEHVDDILAYLPAGDRAALGWVLRLLDRTPSFALRGLLILLEADLPLPGRLAASLRYLRLGLRGLVLSLYYSGEAGQGYLGKSSQAVLGYRVSVVIAEFEGSSGRRRPSGR